ncbi:MAG TPA: PIN domain-containing protein [Bryobacteraceae bacterium]
MMVLADTSIWVDHFRGGDPALADLLNSASVLMHPFVLGELACGNLARRSQVLTELTELPAAVRAEDAEVMELIETRKLYGLGIGWVDAHLIASALLSDCDLLTADQRLKKAARQAGARA